MDERDNEALHAAFQAVLSARPEPELPSVIDAALAGGRRIRRRRRAALSAVGALAVAASAVLVAVTLPTAGTGRAPLPTTPAGTVHPTTSAPEQSEESTAHPAESSGSPGGVESAPGGAESAPSGVESASGGR
jgi:hypothetical protein